MMSLSSIYPEWPMFPTIPYAITYGPAIADWIFGHRKELGEIYRSTLEPILDAIGSGTTIARIGPVLPRWSCANRHGAVCARSHVVDGGFCGAGERHGFRAAIVVRAHVGVGGLSGAGCPAPALPALRRAQRGGRDICGSPIFALA